MGRVVVDVKDFSFKYRQTKHKALKNVSFQVEEGSFSVSSAPTDPVNPPCATHW